MHVFTWLAVLQCNLEFCCYHVTKSLLHSNLFHLHKSNKFCNSDLEESKLVELRILCFHYTEIEFQSTINQIHWIKHTTCYLEDLAITFGHVLILLCYWWRGKRWPMSLNFQGCTFLQSVTKTAIQNLKIMTQSRLCRLRRWWFFHYITTWIVVSTSKWCPCKLSDRKDGGGSSGCSEAEDLQAWLMLQMSWSLAFVSLPKLAWLLCN